MKTIALSLLLLALAIAGAHLSLAPERPALAAISGDVNCDETVNSVDALGVLRSIAGLSTPACNDAADVNCDAAVTAIDSLFILRFVADLPVNLPGGCTPIGEEAAILLLNEVLYLAAPGGHQFAEIKNAGDGIASLAGVTLVNGANLARPLPSGASTLAADAVLLIEFDPPFLDAESDSLELRDGADVLDRVAWGDEQLDGVNLTRGGVALGLEPGTAIARHPASTRPGRLEWSPAAAGAATPGEPNPAPGMGPMLPLDGALVSGEVSLRWYAVPGATSYRVQVSADATFTAPLVDETAAVAALDPGPLAAGGYYWRLEPLSESGDAGFSAAQSFTVSGAAASAALDGPAPDITAHKDTAMLLLESPNKTGRHAWDFNHGQFDPEDPADAMNAVPAAVAMVNTFLGGSLSQDRISFEVMKGRRPGPERDLGWNDAYSREQGLQAMAFALGSVSEFCSTNQAQVLASLLDALNAGSPLVALAGEHPLAVSGYRREVHPPDPAKTFITVHDPFLGMYEADFEKAGFECLWRPPEGAFPGFDEPEISSDMDGDGIVDFDEMFRFGTSPLLADTDGDGRGDKQDIAESVFHHEFGYAGEVAFVGAPLDPNYRPRDYDGDAVDPELDCDSDNDGTRDGFDTDNYSAPPVVGTFVPCGPGTGVVTLAWNSVTDLNLYVLPLPAIGESQAYAQRQMPGYGDDLDYECWLVPDNVTQREAVVTEATVDSHYVGVYYNHKCPYNPEGPHGSSDYVLTIHFADGRVEVHSDFLSRDLDRPGEFWRLYGPFDFAPPP